MGRSTQQGTATYGIESKNFDGGKIVDNNVAVSSHNINKPVKGFTAKVQRRVENISHELQR